MSHKAFGAEIHPLVRTAAGNTADLSSIGVFGSYVSSGVKYTGVFRDHSDGVWKFFTGLTAAPTRSLVPLNGAGYTDASVQAAKILLKAADCQLVLGPAATAVTLSATGSAARTLVLPDASDTLVGRSTTDTLTNKSLTAPVVTGGSLASISTLSLRDTSAAYDLKIASVSSVTLTAGRTLTLDSKNADRKVALGGDLSISSGFTTAGNYSVTLSSPAGSASSVTLPQSGTLATLAGTETFTNKSLTSPSIIGGSFMSTTHLSIRDSSAPYDVRLTATSLPILSADRIVTFDVKNASRTVELGGSLSLAGDFTTVGTGAAVTLRATGTTDVTLPVSGTLSTLAGSETLSNKTISGGVFTAMTQIGLRDSSAAFDVAVSATSNPALTSARTLVFNVSNGSRQVSLAGDISTASSFSTSGAFPLVLTSTASTNVTLPTSGTLSTLSGTETLTNKTISSPSITSGTASALTTLSVRDTMAAYNLGFVSASSTALTADRALTFDVKNAARNIALGGDLSVCGTFRTLGGYSLDLTTTAATTLTLPVAGTLATLAGTETFTNKTINGGSHTAISTLGIRDTSAPFDVRIAAVSSTALTTDRTLTVDVKNAARAVALGGDLSLAGGFVTLGAFGTTLTATGTTTLTLPTTGTLSTLAGAETLTNKTISGASLTAVASLCIRDASAAFDVKISPSSSVTLTAGRTLTLDVRDGNRTVALGGDISLAGGFATLGAFGTTLTATATTTLTLPTTGTLSTLAGAETLTNKTVSGGSVQSLTALSLRDTAAAFDLKIASSSTAALTADRTLTLDVKNASRTVTLGGDLSLAGGLATSGAFPITLVSSATTSVTLPTSGTLSTLAGTETLTNKTVSGGSAVSLATLSIRDTSAVYDVKIAAVSGVPLTADRTFTLDVKDGARTVCLSGNLSLAGNFATSGAFPVTLTATASTAVTLPVTGTLATLAGAETLTNKSIVGGAHTSVTSFSLRDASTLYDLKITASSSVTSTSNNTFTLDTKNASRTLAMAGDLSFAGDFSTLGAFPLALTSTAPTSLTLPVSGTLSTLAGTETLTNKTVSGGIVQSIGTFSLRDASAAFDVKIATSSNPALTTGRDLTFDVKNASRIVALAGDLSLAGNLTTSGAFPMTLVSTATTSVTLPTTGTLATLAGAETFTNKTINGGTHTSVSSFSLRDTATTFDLTLASTSSTALTAGRTLILDVKNASRTVALGGNISTNGDVTFSGAFGLTATLTDNSTITFPTVGTLLSSTRASVTQLTSITTAVTCNGQSGKITTVSSTLGGGAVASFTVNNSSVTASHIVNAFICGYSGTAGVPSVIVRSISDGSFVLRVSNSNGSLNGTLTIGFQLS